MRVTAEQLSAAGLTLEGGVVEIPHPNPVPSGPETLAVKVQTDGDGIRLYPDRFYRHKDLARHLGL